MLDDTSRFMQYALKEAERAYDAGEVPVGCVIVLNNEIIGKAHNQRETLQDPTAHAEVLAITQAAAHLRSWRLEGAKLYVTLEPCPMCAGALVNGRVGRLVYGADDPKAGACGTLMDVVNDRRLNHRMPVTRGVLGEECAGLLREFFRARRRKGGEEE